MKFRTILSDPPWAYENWSARGIGKGAAGHYQTEATSWLESLPVRSIAERDCTLLMWATNPLLPDAFRLIEAWGFTYKSLLTWVKMSRLGAVQIGCGYQVRGCTEHLLIASLGRPPAPVPARRPAGVFFEPEQVSDPEGMILSPRGAHSRKPEFQYELAENYPGPWLDMFSRPRVSGLFDDGMPTRPGWTFLGNEVTGNDIAVDLRALADQPSLFAEATP